LLREAKKFGVKQCGKLGGLTALASKPLLPRGLLVIAVTTIALAPRATLFPAFSPKRRPRATSNAVWKWRFSSCRGVRGFEAPDPSLGPQ
jgi:hypothetical protein